MLGHVVRPSLTALACLGLCFSGASQSAPKPLRATQVIALEAGGASAEDLVREISVRGLSFHPDGDYRAVLKTAGADSTVLAALDKAKITESAADEKPAKELVHQLGASAVVMKDKRYNEAGEKLRHVAESGAAEPEAAFVTGDLLRRMGAFEQAAAFYSRVLQLDPDFPEVHTKLSFILYKLDDSEGALREATAALLQNPNDAEAHKNAGLALDEAQKFDAAILEYKEALRIKPDYSNVHFDLGIHYSQIHDYDDSIVEYRKAIALDPNNPDPHYNLAGSLSSRGEGAEAILELREAKRLNPDDPRIRQNLASELMTQDPGSARVELKELEARFPDFQLCHLCLGRSLAWSGDTKGAEDEFHTAARLDPSDPEAHSGLGGIQETQKHYDAALEEFRIAEKLGPKLGHTHADVARVLTAQKDFAGAFDELKQGETLAPQDWHIHEAYGQSLEASGQFDMAISEFKQAISIDPKQAHVLMELASALEKNGDWPGALDQDRKAMLVEEAVANRAQLGEGNFSWGAEKEYKAAQQRFADHLAKLKASGEAPEADQLEKLVQVRGSSSGIAEEVQSAIQTGSQAFQEKRYDDAEKSFREAITMAEQLPPGDDNLIVAVTRFGWVYSMRKDYANADAAYRRALALVESTFGPDSPRMVDPLFLLGSSAGERGDYPTAEGYYKRLLGINMKLYGENSFRTSESLRTLAGLYMGQDQWDKAEPYLLRAVHGLEVTSGPNDTRVLIPLWGLCDLYDRWNKPEKSQPCWHRATGLMEKQVGENSPEVATSLTNEANALRKLSRNAEAEKLEQRAAQLHKTVAETH